MPIKISVVIPTYRRPQLLRKCLEALLAQTFAAEAYEVIVVSDGYDASTEEIVVALSYQATSLKYLYLSEKRGPAAARNWGWQRAKGLLIAFTDDDTIPDTAWLTNFWNAYHNEPSIAFSGGIKVPLSSNPTDYERNTAGLETADFVTANCCCTKTALEAAGGFDERFSMAWREDSDLEFKLLQQNIPIIKVPGALVVHPVRQAPWGVSLKEQKKGMFNALLYKKYPHLYRKKIQANPAWNYYIMIITFLLLLAGIFLKMKWVSILATVCWAGLLISFIGKRLSRTSRKPDHVLEMIITSLLIPFLSVYWQLYGAWKYRVLFL